MHTSPPIPKKMLFISDVHIGAFSRQKNAELETKLINLINYAQKNDFEIAILGDLFDYWIEYPGFTPSLGMKLLQRFQQFNKNGTRSLYITGNHDNWTLGHFTNRGFDVEPDYRILSTKKHKMLLLHGDAIGDNLDDFERPIFHRLLRNATFLKIYRTLLPPKAGLWLMNKVSQLSRILGQEKSDTSVLNNWAESILKHSDVDYIICGHDHSPRRLNFDFGTYFNLGTFHHHKSLVLYNKGTFKLVMWHDDNKALIPFQPQTVIHE
jgi:UDP-2,3-diacylglucosamine pyrophosphatase LpxH